MDLHLSARVWQIVPMVWEWVAPTGTVVVALAGIGATLRTGSQGRRHAEHLATENHRRARDERLREERLRVYAEALAHAVDQERKLKATWASDGEHAYDLSPKPPGAPLSLASMDEISVRMHLLADREVERAWISFVTAWEGFQWWAEVDYSGDPAENPPANILLPLRTAISNLKDACRRSLDE
ncbi:hypothetical protein [Cellulosimicrobium funkei]